MRTYVRTKHQHSSKIPTLECRDYSHSNAEVAPSRLILIGTDVYCGGAAAVAVHYAVVAGKIGGRAGGKITVIACVYARR